MNSEKEFVNIFLEAEKLLKNNKYTESLKKFENLNKEYPNKPNVINNIGLLYEKLGNLDKSLEFYLKCYSILPSEKIVIQNVANIYCRLNKYDSALPYLKKILDSEVNHEEISEKYAMCLFYSKSKEETKNFVISIISKYPNNKTLNTILGKSLLNLNLHKEGLKYIQKGSGFIELSENGVKYLE